MLYHDVMIDIETTGTNSEKNGILQISAVKFDFESGEINTDFFDRCLHLHPGREWDMNTRQWWVKQGNVLQEIQGRAEDPYTVVRSFYDWLLKDWPTDRSEGLQFWSKPTHFDYTFLVSYLKMFGMDMPCHFRFARDLNSFMAGLSGKATHPEFEVPMEGAAHNALFDTLHQIQLLMLAKKSTTQGVILP